MDNSDSISLRAQQVLDLASTHYGEDWLNDAERQVCCNAVIGEPTNFESKPDDERTLRADRIAWLLTDLDTTPLLSRRSLVVKNAVVNGKPDLEGMELPTDLVLAQCRIPAGIDLSDARLRGLYLWGTEIGELRASGVIVSGDVCLNNGFRATGGVRLLGAEIGGSLNCGGACFEPALNETGALSADRIKVLGSVFLCDGFRATGEVTMLGAEIGGSLNCGQDACFEPTSEGVAALSADRAKISGSVALRKGFKASGEVRLLGAEIGGNLECTNGAFFEPVSEYTDALTADGAKVSGTVFLSNGFNATGKVRLPGAEIGGNLECSNDARFEPASENTDALIADGAKVSGGVYLSDGFTATGEVRLLGVEIGGSLNCSNACFAPMSNDADALVADGAKVSGTVFLRNGFTATACVMMPNLFVGGNFDCSQGIFANKGVALQLRGTCVDGLLGLRFKQKPEGSVDIEHVKAGMLLDDPATWPDRINLLGFDYGRFHSDADQDAAKRIEWLDRCPSPKGADGDERFDPEPYEHLAQVYRKTGRLDDARRVLIEKERRLGQAFEKRWRQVLWMAWGRLAGYGYRTSQPVWLGLMLVALTTLVFWWGRSTYCGGAAIVPPNRLAHIADGQMQEQMDQPSYPAFNPGVYALDVFIPLVDLEQTKYWQPMNNRGWKGMVVVGFMWISIASGWVLTTLFATGLTRAVRE